MASSPKAIKLLKWRSHHEPKRTIRGPLSYWIEGVHRGNGWDALVKTHGAEEALAILGFFNLLQQRTAKLPRELRGYVLDGAHKPASIESVALEYGLDRGRVGVLVDALIDVRWLGYRALRRLLSKPSVALTNNEYEGETKDLRPTTNDERRVTPEKPAEKGGLDSRRRNKSQAGTVSPPSSLSFAGTKRDAFNLLAVKFNRDPNIREQRADLTLIQRIVDHHSHAGKIQPSIDGVIELADKAVSSKSARNKIALWQSFLQTRGLHYKNFKLRMASA